MIIPKKVKIGGSTFKVMIVPTWEDREGCDGECVYSAELGNVIYIGSDLSQEAREITFIHEALHAMNSTINHEFLDSFAEQIYQFLHDNKLI
jgi:hypothetical protein